MEPVPTQPTAPIVWRKGWVYPTVYAVVCLVIGVVFLVAGVAYGSTVLGLILAGVVVLFVGAGAVATAVRRKLTLTPDAVVVRTLWRTAELPLRGITELRRDIGDHGVLAMKAVRIRTAETSIATKSFGFRYKDGMRTVGDAAIARGAQIVGWNTEREFQPPNGQ
ncbi:MAG TPA: hypothetical protein VFW65_30860 [Pseudonocardiaceae bacterium]|nr:hypothetical protein [Pseudonocardiaceae bacterium]